MKKYFAFFILCIIISGCGVSTGIGMGVGVGLGSHSSIGLSTGVMVPVESLSNDGQYKKFYEDNYKTLVKRYNTAKANKNVTLSEIKEIRIKMTALRQEVNTNWKNIEKNRAYIDSFNKKIDPYLSRLKLYEATSQW